VEGIVRILPQAIIALIIAVLLGVGSFFIGTAGPHEYGKWQTSEICTNGTNPVRCIGDETP